VGALVLIHTVQDLSFTTLFCRNYFVGSAGLMKAARVDSAGYFRIFGASSCRCAAHRGDGDLAVHRHLERVSQNVTFTTGPSR
jgi:hypothetical protein